MSRARPTWGECFGGRRSSPSRSTSVASGRATRRRADAFAAALAELRPAHRILGLAAVVLRGATTVLARGRGEANIEARRPVTLDTPFNVASVAKPISAVVALKLV